MKIVLSGNISTGKSTLLSKLHDITKIPVHLEPINEWGDSLKLFYQDTTKWSLMFNLNVIHSMYKWKDNKEVSFYERSPYDCRHVFVNMQVEDKEMHPLELDIFDKVFKELSWKPDIILYIKTSPELCFERMKQRNRDSERGVSFDYIKKVHDQYEEYIENIKKDVSVYEINGNNNVDTVIKDILKLGFFKHL